MPLFATSRRGRVLLRNLGVSVSEAGHFCTGSDHPMGAAADEYNFIPNTFFHTIDEDSQTRGIGIKKEILYNTTCKPKYPLLNSI